MRALLVACDRCGLDSVVKNSDGVFRLDKQKRRLEMVQIIGCPRCGLVERPTTHLNPQGHGLFTTGPDYNMP
jgi:hypothetical protein